jgi:iron complex outermembrane receptor protein
LDLPLLHDLPFVHSLDMNGAFRYTDYSVSGTVSTWKGGLTYEPISDLKLRSTVSRDIRAPNLIELYTPSGLSFTDVNNPATGNTDFARVLTGGNTQLRPEAATTDTFGFVYQPSYVSGLSLSVDWYRINVRSAITTVAPQDLVNFCAAGNTAACDAVVRNSAGTITQINQTYLNIGQFKTSGSDIELRYSTLLPGRAGRLTFRALSTFVDHLQASDGAQLTDVAGAVGIDSGGLPHWRANGNVDYEVGKFGAFLNVRYIGAGKYNNYFTAADLDNIDIPAVWYFNGSVRYTLGERAQGVEIYGGINNIFDKAPPITPQNFIEPWATNPQLYDVVGRFFYAGIRAHF